TAPARKPQLEWKFRYYGVSLRDGGTCHHSDVGTSLALPDRDGEVRYTIFGGAFRVERLSAEQVAKAQPLRRDPKYFRDRVAAIGKELHATYPTLAQHGQIEIAILLREPDLTADLRKMFADWTDRDPASVIGKGWPNDVSDALARLGDASDFALFHRCVKRHPTYADFLITPTLRLVERVGGADAAPLVSDLLQLKDPF